MKKFVALEQNKSFGNFSYKRKDSTDNTVSYVRWQIERLIYIKPSSLYLNASSSVKSKHIKYSQHFTNLIEKNKTRLQAILSTFTGSSIYWQEIYAKTWTSSYAK